MKKCMSYMQGLKKGRAYLWGFTVHVKKSFFSDTPTALIRYTIYFPSWLTILAAKASPSANKTINRTFEIFLPVIPSKVTDPNTIDVYMLYLQSITAKSNMRYANITLNVGAAIDAFKVVLRTYPEAFLNVVIHLRDFHFMKENFKVIFKIRIAMLRC